MKLPLIVVLTFLAAVPARAQQILGQQVGEAERTALKAGQSFNSNESRAGRVIGNISCVGASEISEVIDYAAGNLKIAFAAQSEPAKLSGKTIFLSDKLPDAPRVQIAYVVYEAAAPSLGSFPDSVEKEYMRVSLATRGWMELGGEGNKLPVIDGISGYKDEDLGALLRAWYYGGVPELIAKKQPGLKSVKDLGDAKASKRFDEFKKAETEWVVANGFRFQQ